MKIGYTVWLANNGTNDWDILYSDNTKIVVTANDGSVDGHIQMDNITSQLYSRRGCCY